MIKKVKYEAPKISKLDEKKLLWEARILAPFPLIPVNQVQTQKVHARQVGLR